MATSGPSRSRSITRSTFASLVGTASFFLLLWLAFSGLVAVAGNPYLVAAYWFLGFSGLFACVGAYVEAARDEEEGRPRPLRCMSCLGAGALVGVIFWSQGRPMLHGPGTDLAMVGVVLAIAAVFGIGVLLFLSVLLLSQRWEEGERSAPELSSRRDPRRGVPVGGLVA